MGEDIVFTTQYADSHIEICVTGTVFSSTQFPTSDRFGNLAINVNVLQNILKTVS
nr:MAG: hypothetical protein CM15mV30_1430 [uncultured marine virus]